MIFLATDGDELSVADMPKCIIGRMFFVRNVTEEIFGTNVAFASRHERSEDRPHGLEALVGGLDLNRLKVETVGGGGDL